MSTFRKKPGNESCQRLISLDIARMRSQRVYDCDVLKLLDLSPTRSQPALTLEKWRQVMSVNLDGVFLGIKYALQIMKQSGSGSIINLSSVGGLVGTMDSAPYNASKGGVRLLTKAAAIEFSKAGYDYNIRVNSIHPGVIETPMTAPLISDPQGGPQMLSWTPMGHFGEPLDVAYGALYLASDESKFLTGSELVIDGGWSAQ